MISADTGPGESRNARAESPRISNVRKIQPQEFRAMKPNRRFVSVLGSALIVTVMAGYACAAGYTQTNLVTNGGDPAVKAAVTDPKLGNPLGISFPPAIPGGFSGTPFSALDNKPG